MAGCQRLRVHAGLDLVALSETDISVADAAESDTSSVSASEDNPSRMPAWAHALVDQVRFPSPNPDAPDFDAQQGVGSHGLR